MEVEVNVEVELELELELELYLELYLELELELELERLVLILLSSCSNSKLFPMKSLTSPNSLKNLVGATSFDSRRSSARSISVFRFWSFVRDSRPREPNIALKGLDLDLGRSP